MSELRRLRAERGLSQSALARRVGVTDKVVWHWENEGIKNARYGLMRKVAHVLGVPMEALDGERDGERDGGSE